MAMHAAARETVCALRREIARIEGVLPETLESADDGIVARRNGVAGRGLMLPLGAPLLDAALGGGLPFAALTEIHGAETRDAGAVAGFALALAVLAKAGAPADAPVLWIAPREVFSEAGEPYAPGIAQRFGIAPEALLVSRPRRIEEALWVAEEAAALSVLATVILEVRGEPQKLDLTATRRLHRRAQAAGRPLLLLRQAGSPAPTAAPVRLAVAPAPAGERMFLSGALSGSIGPPAVAVIVARSRSGASAAAELEWDRNEHVFRERRNRTVGTQDTGAVVPAPADGPYPAGEAGKVVAFDRTAA